ncbi:MAG: sigma-70 family RNA polymerase sigma factor [Chitinophagaceae bacterium]|nr:sigma-70 family RNA polymerase sigma factor [Chitinophagaceae bacterium]
MHEDDLIHSIIKGNIHAYEILIKQYQANVFRTAMGFVHCKEDAEEITQDVFIKFINHYNLKGTSAFSTWLYRITINTSLNYLRKKKQELCDRTARYIAVSLKRKASRCNNFRKI